MGWQHAPLRASGGRRSGTHAHDLGNHVARAAHDHRVADAHVLALDLIHVVQRGVADGGAADQHRLQARHRRQRAGAADLEFDVAQHRERLVGRELVGDRPARRALDMAEAFLLVARRFTL